jgi:hypothetical protein
VIDYLRVFGVIKGRRSKILSFRLGVAKQSLIALSVTTMDRMEYSTKSQYPSINMQPSCHAKPFFPEQMALSLTWPPRSDRSSTLSYKFNP